jgi:hypothetical protein
VIKLERLTLHASMAGACRVAMWTCSGRSTPSLLLCTALRTACSRARYAAHTHNSAHHAFNDAENSWFTVADTAVCMSDAKALRTLVVVWCPQHPFDGHSYNARQGLTTRRWTRVVNLLCSCARSTILLRLRHLAAQAASSSLARLLIASLIWALLLRRISHFPTRRRLCCCPRKRAFERNLIQCAHAHDCALVLGGTSC